MNKKQLLIAFQFLLMAILLECRAQPWHFVKNFGSTEMDISNSFVQYPNGDIFLVGTSNANSTTQSDIAVVKLKPNGDTLWTKYYGDLQNDEGLFINLCSDGKIILCGETYSSANLRDAIVYKLDTAGNVIWNKTYSTPVNESLKYIEEIKNKEYILVGLQNDGGGKFNHWFVKIDSLGTVILNRDYGTHGTEYADLIRPTKDGGFLFSGDTNVNGVSNTDYELYKIDSLGVVLWDSLYGDNVANGCQGLVLTKSGNILLYGETALPSDPIFDFFLHLVDSSGKTIWKKVWGGIGSDAVFGAAETADKGFICTGYSSSYNINDNKELIIFKVDSNGNVLWHKEYGTPGVDIGLRVSTTIYGGYLVAGRSDGMNNEGDFFLLSLTELGDTLMQQVVLPNDITEILNPNEVLIFPNPAHDRINIEFPATSTVKSCRLFSLEGKEIDCPFSVKNNTIIIENEELKGTFVVELLFFNSNSQRYKVIFY